MAEMHQMISFILLSILISINGYRLPTNVMPENYKLEIITPFGEVDNFNFTGKVWIQTSCVTPTTNITLHSKDLEIEEKDVTVKDISSKVGKEIKDIKISSDIEHDFLIIILPQSLVEDHRYEIYIPFKGVLNDGLAGFYRSSYIDQHTNEKKWLGVTQFEAISARKAFPCFDEPEMKATFDISIARKDGYRAISNMPLLLTEPFKEKPGWYWDRFDISVPMSTYLVAYVVSDFEYKEAEPLPDMNNVTFRIWARKDALDQVDFAKEVGPKSLRFYEQFFNIDYPLSKQDMVAVPDFSAGAMENWGLITYREAYLLYDPKVSSKTSQHSVASVIAHELAHQWFGNLVTMKWWTDLWLNEGFATYMAGVAVDHLFPQWNSLEDEAASSMLTVFSFDSLKSSHPVSVRIGNPKEIDEIFDTISYKKGASLIRMMGLFLGHEILRQGVSNYLRKHRYHNAEQDDLWDALSEVAHNKGSLPKEFSVKTIMDSWTLKTGYPLITVKRNYEKGSTEITQERFLRLSDENKNRKKDSCWWIPLSYSTSSHLNFNETTPKQWLNCPQKETLKSIENIAANDEWVIFNNKMAAIYKVNYDEKNWQLLTDALQSPDQLKNIPILNRVQLIADSADLAYVGKLKYNVFFDLIGYLKNENEYLPWSTAIGKTDAINVCLIYNPSYGIFKNYLKKLLTPTYEKIGGFDVEKPEEKDKLDKIKLHSLIIGRSCKFGVNNCIDDAKKLFKQWQNAENTSNPIPKDIRKIVYCTALKYGNEKEWNFLWHKYEESNVATEKNSILNVLGCTREIWLLSRYLEWSLDDTKIRRQDAQTAFASVGSNDVGVSLTRNFFYKNINRIFKHLQPNKRRLTRYLLTVAGRLICDKELEEMKNFIESNKDKFSSIKQGVKQAIETAQINIQWQDKHAEEIKNVLEKYLNE